jgi:hypothetical protein
MPSLIWGSIFLLLILELVVTFALALPVPRKIRNVLAREIFKFHVGDKLRKPILYVGIALFLALMESYFSHRRLVNRMMEEHGVSSYSHDIAFHPHDKERKYKAERNMYLAGFSLTLLFVIGRITTLMQESVELEEETERVRKFVGDSKKAEAKHNAASDKKTD